MLAWGGVGGLGLVARLSAACPNLGTFFSQSSHPLPLPPLDIDIAVPLPRTPGDRLAHTLHDQRITVKTLESLIFGGNTLINLLCMCTKP